MNAKPEGKSHNRKISGAVALLAFSIVAAPLAFAGGKVKGGGAENVTMLSHVEFTGGTAGKMQLAMKHQRRLLFVGVESSQEVRVVDVSDPAQPRLVDQSSATSTAPKLTAVKSSISAPELFSVLNTAGDSSTREAHKFSASARFLTDARHSLVYVVDSDGLWIVRVKQSFVEYTAPYDNTDYTSLYGG
ncbi:MAG: hypothetical protein ACRD5M_16725 [Candidatus Acidiferrales bacterium]